MFHKGDRIQPDLTKRVNHVYRQMIHMLLSQDSFHFSRQQKRRSYDFPGAYSLLAEYCSKNLLSARMASHLQIAYEELVQQILFPQRWETGIRFTAEYSEQDENIHVIVKYKGEPVDLTAAAYELPLTLLKGISSGMRHETEPEGNVISLNI